MVAVLVGWEVAEPGGCEVVVVGGWEVVVVGLADGEELQAGISSDNTNTTITGTSHFFIVCLH